MKGVQDNLQWVVRHHHCLSWYRHEHVETIIVGETGPAELGHHWEEVEKDGAGDYSLGEDLTDADDDVDQNDSGEEGPAGEGEQQWCRQHLEDCEEDGLRNGGGILDIAADTVQIW